MTASTVAAGSATISTSETLQSVASRSRSGSQWSGARGRDRHFGLLALPIVLFFLRPSRRDQDLLAELEQLVPAGIAPVVVPARVRLRELRQVNACWLAGRSGPVLPQLVGRVRNDRGQQPGQVIVQGGQYKLGGLTVAARRVPRRRADPSRRRGKSSKLDGAELVDPLIDPVKLEPFVRRPDVADHLVELAQSPAIDFVQRGRVDALPGQTTR